MNVSLDKNIDTADSIKIELFVFVISPISFSCHVVSAGIILFVTFSEHNVSVKGFGQSSALVGFDPRIVIEATLNINAVSVAMEPDIYDSLAVTVMAHRFSRTGNQNVLIVRNKILNDLLGGIDDVHISPVHP